MIYILDISPNQEEVVDTAEPEKPGFESLNLKSYFPMSQVDDLRPQMFFDLGRSYPFGAANRPGKKLYRVRFQRLLFWSSHMLCLLFSRWQATDMMSDLTCFRHIH